MSDEPDPPEVTIFVEKSAFFRVVHADGTLCAFSPSGNVCLTFYNDHASLPKKMVEGVDNNGFATGEIREKRCERKGYDREVETEIVMSKELRRGSGAG
ncbi:MAG: hypothetical protein WDN28_30695 [Chthoniobacter sp.]